MRRMERAEYNNILEDFVRRILGPAAQKQNITFTMTEAEAGLDRWMDESTAELLRRFSQLANMGTGAAHPNDRARWNAFVLAAHRTNCTLDGANLRRWLVEVEGWPPEIAEDLASEYETGREMVAYAVAH